MVVADVLTEQHAYVTFTVLLCIGLYMLIANDHLVKKIIGLNLFQTAIFLFLIAVAYVEGGATPIVPPDGGGGPYVSPLPHVLVLTAIVVGVSLTAVGLALTIRIYSEFGTLRTDVLREVLHEEADTRPAEERAAPANDRYSGTSADGRYSGTSAADRRSGSSPTDRRSGSEVADDD